MRAFQVILFLLIPWSFRAQDVKFTASAAPNVLRVGEQFNLTYTSNQELDEINMPEIRDFELLGGPSQGHSQSVFAENGKVTTSSTWTYTYFFRAVKEGKFTIPPATVKIKNKTLPSNAVTVEIVKGREPSPAQGQPVSTQGSSQNSNVSDKDLFVSVILDKKEAYIGEQIMATIKIFTRVNLLGVDQRFKGPDFTGFFTEPVAVPPLRSLQREAVDGDVYGTGILRKVVIIPQKSGELVIQPFELDVSLRQEVRRKFADPFFDDFSIPEVQEIPLKIKSKAVKLVVKSLPPNAPKTFQGAVGNFRLKSEINKTTTTTNDPLTLKVTVSGRGNLKLLNEVGVTVPYDMEKYDPVINTRMDNPLSGTKTFEYLIVPKLPGKFTIPPVELTYFDAGTSQYKTLRTEAYLISVEKGAGDTLIASMPGMTKEDVKLLNQDIRFIKTKPFTLNRTNAFIMRSPGYYLLYLLALGIFMAVLWNRNRLLKQNADIAGLKLRKADKYARKRLKNSEVLLKQGNDAAFYEELLGAIWGYLSDKLGIPVATLSKESANTALLDRGVDQGIMDRLFSVTETCEMARYAHSSGDIARDKLYREALEAISDLQQKLK
ncbi:MAG: protein BatD [Bacteroidales bacterium]|nr:protein BatD [Bacteroidales bacterium]